MIALVTDQNIPSFDENLNLIDSTVLDLENLKHGARIRMSSLASNSDGVTALIADSKQLDRNIENSLEIWPN